MPLAGSLDIRPLMEGAPEVVLDDRELKVDDVDILHVLYEVRVDDRESLVPPALNPTIPPVISLLVYRAKDSSFGPFASGPAPPDGALGCAPPRLSGLGSMRQSGSLGGLGQLVGVPHRPRCRRLAPLPRPRGLHRARATMPPAATGPARRSSRCRWSTRCRSPATTCNIRRGCTWPGCVVTACLVPRIVQVDCEYEFRRADRGRPELVSFDAGAWGDERLVPDLAVSASFAACDMTIANVRYLCNPDIPAAEGTEKVSDR